MDWTEKPGDSSVYRLEAFLPGRLPFEMVSVSKL